MEYAISSSGTKGYRTRKYSYVSLRSSRISASRSKTSTLLFVCTYVVFVQRNGSVPSSVGSCLSNNLEHFVLYAVYLFPILCTLFLVFSTISVITSGGRVWPVLHSILKMIAQELLSCLLLSRTQRVNVLRWPRFHKGHYFWAFMFEQSWITEQQFDMSWPERSSYGLLRTEAGTERKRHKHSFRCQASFKTLERSIAAPSNNHQFYRIQN